MTARTIALLTDYGWTSHFVGAMKAVMLGITSEVAIVDLSHGIAPQAVEEGAFVLGAVLPFLPEAAICVGVVDPGVGTARAPIALERDGRVFIGPDNGLFSATLSDAQRPAGGAAAEARPVAVPPDCRAFRLDNSHYFHTPVSDTFHGRDIFAPVAAHIAAGTPLPQVGNSVQTLLAFPPWRAPLLADGGFGGRVLLVDHFGNLITDVRAADVQGRDISTEVGGLRVAGLRHSYQDGPEFIVYPGSSGFLEVAQRNGNAARALGLSAGASVRVTVRPRSRPAVNGENRGDFPA